MHDTQNCSECKNQKRGCDGWSQMKGEKNGSKRWSLSFVWNWTKMISTGVVLRGSFHKSNKQAASTCFVWLSFSFNVSNQGLGESNQTQQSQTVETQGSVQKRSSGKTERGSFVKSKAMREVDLKNEVYGKRISLIIEEGETKMKPWIRRRSRTDTSLILNNGHVRLSTKIPYAIHKPPFSFFSWNVCWSRCLTQKGEEEKVACSSV